MNLPLFLVTNDDGVDAAGIRALVSALKPLGDTFVVAPDREVSACAQSLTLSRPIDAREVEPRVFAVDGTPADCVHLAIERLLPRRPDVVLSGINRGANLGEDVFYSGTVGGAREGVFYGVPALAVSLATRGGADFAPAAAIAVRLTRLVLERGLPGSTLLNVNVPQGEPSRAVVTVQGRRIQGVLSESYGTSGGERAAEAGPVPPGPSEARLTDYEAVQRGLVSVTPLHSDTTFYDALPILSTWNLVFRNGHGP
jgi:5'-nucleotidase